MFKPAANSSFFLELAGRWQVVYNSLFYVGPFPNFASAGSRFFVVLSPRAMPQLLIMLILAYLQIGLCLFCASPAVNKDILGIIPIFKGRFHSISPFPPMSPKAGLSGGSCGEELHTTWGSHVPMPGSPGLGQPLASCVLKAPGMLHQWPLQDLRKMLLHGG